MKIVLVSPETSDQKKLEGVLSESNREDCLIFHYYHPLKAIDNLEEIQPELILWSIIDFPRHWKALIPLARESSLLRNTRMILFANHQIDSKEADKARFLEVAGILQQGLSSPETVDLLKSLIPQRTSGGQESRLPDDFSPEDDRNQGRPIASPASGEPAQVMNLEQTLALLRHEPASGEDCQLFMSHPLRLKVLRGQVLALDPDSIEFKPQDPRDFDDLPDGTLLGGCNLRLAGQRVKIDLKLHRSNGLLDLVVQEPQKLYTPLISSILRGKIPQHSLH